MDNLISRQAAIELIESEYRRWGEEYGITDVLCDLDDMPAAEPERKAPISDKEQLSLDCSFCRQHECGDTLYESSDWDGGIGFDYIRDIRFCPICGRELYGGE